MKAKITLASKRDRKPTISAKKLGCITPCVIIEMIIDNKRIESFFHISRNKKTYYANNWDKSLPLPITGNPLNIDIVSIKHIIEQKML